MIILTVALWPSVAHDRLFLWLGAFLVSLIPRIGIGIRFLKTKPAGAKAEPWARNFAVGTFTGGLFGAAVPIFLFPGDNIFAQAPIHFILGGPVCWNHRFKRGKTAKPDAVRGNRDDCRR